MISYNVSVNEGTKTSVTLFHEGVPYVATSEHPNFDKIIRKLEAGREVDKIVELFDLTKPIFDRFDHLSERVTVACGQIFFDGDPVNDVLSEAIVNYYKEDNEDYKRLVYFLEKLANNPNEHSRENLYAWLANNSFAIAPDGDFIAYKGLTTDRKSIHAGKATVNGIVFEGQIPNAEGDVVEMPRSDVQHDPRQGCHTGLHAGTWSYASSFGHGTTIKVKINPRDVVSVPVDCGAQKLRCCRYQALEVTDAPERSMQYSYGDTDWDDDWADDWDLDDEYEDDEPTSAFEAAVGGLYNDVVRKAIESLFARDPYKAQTAAAEYAERSEARRRELTDLNVASLVNVAVDLRIDLVPIVVGKTIAHSIPGIVDAIIAVEFTN